MSPQEAAEKLLNDDFDTEAVVTWVHWRWRCASSEIMEKVVSWLVRQHQELSSQMVAKDQLLLAHKHTIRRYRKLYGPLPLAVSDREEEAP